MTGARMRFGAGATVGGRGYRLGSAALIAVGLAAAAPAGALVVQADPAAVMRAPDDATAFDHVGKIGGRTGVYLGDGWVLTAAHVGAGELELGGGRYPALPGSWVALRGGADERGPDIGLFRVEPHPPLPRLEIARRAPRPGDPLLLVGCGVGRGEPVEWDGSAGWRWAGPNACRWGRNRVAAAELDAPAGIAPTRVFATLFSDGDPDEAQAAPGDSGGAAFIPRPGGSGVLVGIMIAVKGFPHQPPQTSLIGNTTYVADLSHYRDEILALTGADAPR